MSLPTLPHDPPRSIGSDAEGRLDSRLGRLEDLVEAGNREGRRSGRAFIIFAVLALLLAFGTLIAVVAKLQDQSSTSTATASAPAKTASTTKPASTGLPAAPVPASQIRVALREYTIAPSSYVGKAGKITFAVTNAGTMTHEFVVLRTNQAASALMKGNEADESGNVGETGDVAAGQSKTVALNLKPGHYALICNLPGHYANGQYTDFNVK